MSLAELNSFPVGIVEMSVDELLTALTDSEVLDTLQITNQDLLLARSDFDLLATLRIFYELVIAFRDAGVLDTFFGLPVTDQADFLGWVGATDDRELRRDRIGIFASALRKAPLRADGSPAFGPIAG